MNYDLTDEQQSLAELTQSVFGAGESPRKEAGRLDGDRLWRAAASAGLLGIAATELNGGSGQGVVEACVVAHGAGLICVTLPFANAMATLEAIEAIDLPSFSVADVVAGGSTILMPLGAGDADLASPAVGYRTDSHQLDGPPLFVTEEVDHVLVWALVDGSTPAVVVLDTAAAGIVVEHVAVASGSGVRYHVDGVHLDPSRVVTGPDIADLRRRAWSMHVLLTCAEMCGLAEAALRLTADYASRRHQFKRPIGTFQAVATRLADGYIDVEAMRWTMWRAASAYSAGQSDHRRIVTARVWACQGGDRVLATAQHIHGGLGVDVSYPLHAFYLRMRHLLLAVGGAEHHLAQLGSLIAEAGQ